MIVIRAMEGGVILIADSRGVLVKIGGVMRHQGRGGVLLFLLTY